MRQRPDPLDIFQALALRRAKDDAEIKATLTYGDIRRLLLRVKRAQAHTNGHSLAPPPSEICTMKDLLAEIHEARADQKAAQAELADYKAREDSAVQRLAIAEAAVKQAHREMTRERAARRRAEKALARAAKGASPAPVLELVPDTPGPYSTKQFMRDHGLGKSTKQRVRASRKTVGGVHLVHINGGKVKAVCGVSFNSKVCTPRQPKHTCRECWKAAKKLGIKDPDSLLLFGPPAAQALEGPS